MCPFGDSVFIHKCGSVPIDVIFQRYIDFCEIDLINKRVKMSKVKWTRNDFLCNDNDNDNDI